MVTVRMSDFGITVAAARFDACFSVPDGRHEATVVSAPFLVVTTKS